MQQQQLQLLSRNTSTSSNASIASSADSLQNQSGNTQNQNLNRVNERPVILNQASRQIRQVRIRKELEFLSQYSYDLQENQHGTVIYVNGLWPGKQDNLSYKQNQKRQLKIQSDQCQYQLQFSNKIVGTQLQIHIPKQYPFKPPRFVHNLKNSGSCPSSGSSGSPDSSHAISIPELIDQWSPRYKIMQMIELIKKRLEQRNELYNYLSNNIIFEIFKGMNNLQIWIIVAILVRVLVGFGGYSGKGDPPGFGDFQAHRNWMAVTLNRPIGDWYTQTDKQPWWRIDYPPVAAYLSYLLAIVYQKVEPKALMPQKGYQSASLQSFMRGTVILLDCLLLLPAIYLLVSHISPLKHRNKSLFLASIMLYFLKPDQILIDHGHFQYNTLMIGLILYSLYFLLTGKKYLCCIFYTLAINCKLMAVYYCLAFFGGLVGRTLRKYGWARKKDVLRECFIYAAIVIGVTALVWSPWLMSIKSFSTVVQAIFPIHRGLYQLKVPNFWCITDTLLSYQSFLSKPFLTFLCAVLSFSLSVPSTISLILHPTQKTILLAFSCISMTFFLFSYHVHQKSILVPLATIMFCGEYVGGALVVDLVIGGCMGMYHLLVEDGVQMGYWILVCLWGIYAVNYYRCQEKFLEIYHHQKHSHSHSNHSQHQIHLQLSPSKSSNSQNSPFSLFALMLYSHKKYYTFSSIPHVLMPISFVTLHLLQIFMNPPQKLPYLWNLLFAFYSFCLNAYFVVLANVMLIGDLWRIYGKVGKKQ